MAITALSLSSLSAAHWTAQAAFIISLITGCLSVFFACILQQKLSSLFRAEDVKDWLSKTSHRRERRIVDELISTVVTLRERDRETGITDAMIEIVTEIVTAFRDENRWKAASFNSAVIIRAPALLLNYSVGAFLIGLGIYLGSVATKNLNPTAGQGASRAVLIVFVVTTAVGILLYLIPTILKSLELAPVRRWDLLLVKKQEAAQQDPQLRANAKLEQLFEDTQKKLAMHKLAMYKAGSTDQKKAGQADRDLRNERLDDTARSRSQAIQIVTPIDETPHGSDSIVAFVNTLPDQDVPDPTGDSQRPDAAAHVQLQSELLLQTKPSDHSIFADPILAAINASVLAHEQSAATQRVLLKELQGREQAGCLHQKATL